ncbi:MAG: PLP-dependent transferase [Chitinophagaceae bacterium]|nr:PLP-dependent transferase [Chitinophagaceae bacterium]
MNLSYILNELGEERENYFQAIAPPIVQTSNYAFKTVEDLRRAFEDEMSDYLYSRGIHPTLDILRKKLAALDDAEECLVFNSGAAAIFAAVLAFVKSGDHIVSVRNPYTWAQRMFDNILPRFGITTTYIDGSQIQHWQNALQPNTVFFYLESPNSWNYSIQPVSEVAGLAKENNIITLLDNSYCTPLYQQPLSFGIDLAMQTATKYISGHSDTLGGILCGSRRLLKKIFDTEYLAIGSGIQPFNAWLLIRGLRTLPLRLQRIFHTTKQVIRFLKQHPKVEKILFPLDESFPHYRLATQQMKDAGGLFTFVLKTPRRDDIVRFCESLQHILMAVSWGGHESLILPKCAAIPPHEFDSSREEHRYIRMYVGLEEADYLIRDLENALEKI